jgi:CheY-like chemotaxis protein
MAFQEKRSMGKKRILIIDIDILTAQILKTLLNANNYETTWVTDGDEALLVMDSYDFDIIVMELTIPGINGRELIEKIRGQGKRPLFIIHSYAGEKKNLEEMLKMDVEDYLIKPFNREEALFKINKARSKLEGPDDTEVKNDKNFMAKELDWKLWKADTERRNNTNFEKSFFYNMKTSICQGAGFGAMVSLLSLAKNRLVVDDETYIIDKKIMDLVFQNNQIMENILIQITEIADIVDSHPERESVPLEELQRYTIEEAKKLKDYAKFKNQKISLKPLSVESNQKKIRVNSSLMRKAFAELLINAFKFSQKDSSISIQFFEQNSKLLINFASKPEPMPSGATGIPLQYEKLVFTPFFRLAKSVFENYRSLDYGLGLTACHHIISKHDGIIVAYNEERNAGNGRPEIIVHVNIELALQNP